MSRDEFPLLAPEEPGAVMELTDVLIRGLGIPAEFLQDGKSEAAGSSLRYLGTLTDAQIKGLGIPAEFLQETADDSLTGHASRIKEAVGQSIRTLNIPKRQPNTVHAIAHFDFDGSCGDCACNNEDGGICNLPDTGFNTSDVPKGQRHEHCPLCIEEG